MSYRQSNKQETLQSGTNIKTINGNSILGSGNLSVGGGSFSGTMDDIPDGTTYVKTENNLTDAEKTILSNTSGTNTGDETTATIQTKLGTASASTSGYLTSTDWNTFNNKQPAGTYATGTGTATGTNTGDQTSIVGISGTKAQFDTACSDGNFLYVGDQPSLSYASAFCTATTTISAATYADITGASITLAAGTWIIFAHVVGAQPNAIIQMFCAITDGSNNVIAESAQSRPASGTASLNSPMSCSFTAVVTPSGSTTYKLRAARGLTTHTGSWVVYDGSGYNTTNHATNNTDKGTSIIAIRIA